MTILDIEATPPPMETDIRVEPMAEFKRRAEAALSGRVRRVTLFGSRVRGDAEPDSDWDVAVFVSGTPSPADRRALADTAYDLLLDSGAFIRPIAIPFARLEEDSLFSRHIRDEGILV